eukprot:scaffold82247_cov26-Tisochrysis_lutea.AAC.2
MIPSRIVLRNSFKHILLLLLLLACLEWPRTLRSSRPSLATTTIAVYTLDFAYSLLAPALCIACALSVSRMRIDASHTVAAWCRCTKSGAKFKRSS